MKKTKYVIVLLSSILFWLMLSEASAKHLFINCFFGGISALFLMVIMKKYTWRISKIIGLCSFVISGLFFFLLYNHFFSAWESSSKLKEIGNHIGLSDNGLLIIAGIVLALVSCVSVFVFASLVISLVFSLFDFSSLSRKFKALFSVKNILKKLSIAILCLVSSGVLGTLLMFGVYNLPIERIDNNVSKSAYELNEEDVYYSLFSWCTSQLDNFTDSIMLLEASDKSPDTTINRAMLNYRGKIADPEYKDPFDTLIKHYVDKKDYTSTKKYPRYWHGYHVVLKPLLLLFSYKTIRIINLCVQISLVVFSCVLMKIKGLKDIIIPYIISYLMLMPVALAFSLQFSACFLIFSIGNIVILLLSNVLERYLFYIFLFLGIATSFLDLLTYPIVTFGMPIILTLSVLYKLDLESKLVIVIKSALLWVLGYLGMWASKWLIGSVLTGENVIWDGLSAVERRTDSQVGSEHAIISRESSVTTNLDAFFNTPVTVVFIIFCVISIISIIWLLVKFRRTIIYVDVMRNVFLYFLISVTPLVWYSVVVNHSCVHFWFTNKNLVIMVFGILVLLTELKKVCVFQADNKKIIIE